MTPPRTEKLHPSPAESRPAQVFLLNKVLQLSPLRFTWLFFSSDDDDRTLDPLKSYKHEYLNVSHHGGTQTREDGVERFLETLIAC